MKKTNLSRKTNAVRDAKPSQKKISMYFTNASKDEVFKDKDSMINSIIGNSTSSEGVCKKRKLSGDLELLETRMKIVKSDDTSDAYNSNTLHEQNYAFTSESNAICNISRDKRKCVIETSPKKNLTIGEYKENIDLDRCKNIVYKQNEKKVEPLNIQSVNKKENMTNSVENESINASDFALETCIMDNFNDCFEEEWCVNNQINFDSFQRCTVTDVKNEYSSTLLTVEQEDSALSGTVMCSGFWKDVKVKKYDIVAIQARKESRYWVVDNTSGFLVIHSDMLISGTTVVSGLFCSRKAVLAEKFKKLESLPYFEGDQTPLVIGSLAHQLLQKAICENVHVMSDITKLLDEILQSKETISTLYATEIKFDECRKQMLAFVPKIFNFIRHYLKDEKQQEISNIKDSFKGRITRVRDIEENIWLPKLGVKGKVDVTVEVSLNSKRKLMPLEIKTGKPSFSLEHRGQLILYIMMMALTGQDTDTGLLLYLRENNMQEIKCKHPEKRDLILLRNTIANYIAPKLVDKSLELTSEPDLEMLQLPEPINHHRACSTCSYNALCCSYLSRDPEIQLSESHPLAQLSKQILEKFKPAHIDYIIKWVSLLQIEENAQTSDNITRYMWTLSPEKREEKKLCISNLKLISKVVEHSSKYQHTFGRGDVDIPYTEFSENEYVIVSTDTRVNVSAGFIMYIEKYSITVLLDRDISKYNMNESLHIDKYSHSTLFSLNIANVGGLLGDNEICAKLRDIVIDRKPATFSKGVPHSIVRKSAEIIHELNENQQRAVLKAMSANEYILIKGMPGTGKTQTLVALISLLNKTGYSVLIAGHTNGCVDNILLRLLEKDVDFLRLGSSAVHPLVQHKSERHMIANCNSVESLETVYSSKNIVGVTCASSNHVLLSKRTFDVCIVDESAQALQSSVLRPLYSAHKFVLVGDPDQLPPIVKSKTARKLGADESLFSRLDSANNTITLTKQYRMNKIIMRLANKFTYNDALEVGSASIESATFAATNSEILAKEGKWIQQALSQSIHDSVVLLNTGCTSDMKMSIESSDKYLGSDQKHSNVWEVAVIMNLLQALFKMNVDHRSIGIIAPYRAHVSLLKGIVPNSIEVNTVDQYQGRDKEIIIYTCARSSSSNNIINKDLEILGDHRRLTVAITRAKHKLIIIADTSTVSQYLPFKKLFNFVEEKNIINLRDCCDDFSWRNVATLLQGHAF